jgi:hypothetical protein
MDAHYPFIFGWKRFLKNQELSHFEFWKRDTAQVGYNGLHDETIIREFGPDLRGIRSICLLPKNFSRRRPLSLSYADNFYGITS